MANLTGTEHNPSTIHVMVGAAFGKSQNRSM